MKDDKILKLYFQSLSQNEIEKLFKLLLSPIKVSSASHAQEMSWWYIKMNMISVQDYINFCIVVLYSKTKQETISHLSL